MKEFVVRRVNENGERENSDCPTQDGIQKVDVEYDEETTISEDLRTLKKYFTELCVNSIRNIACN